MKPLYRVIVKHVNEDYLYHIYADNEEEAKETCKIIYKVLEENIKEVSLVS